MIWPDFYTLLRVDPGANAAALDQARERALASLPETRTRRLLHWLRGESVWRIDRAHRLLTDPARRARYDLDRWLERIQREAPFH
ncbi:MAG: DnaJ domain [Pseudomonadota bacterium]|jgi:hypothetical protein